MSTKVLHENLLSRMILLGKTCRINFTLHQLIVVLERETITKKNLGFFVVIIVLYTNEVYLLTKQLEIIDESFNVTEPFKDTVIAKKLTSCVFLSYS